MIIKLAIQKIGSLPDYPRYKIHYFPKSGIFYVKRDDGRITTPYLDKGYYRINLIDLSGKYKLRQVHRLIAQVWLDNPTSLLLVDHRDGNPQNNRLDNLRWASYRTNNQLYILGYLIQ